MFKLIFTCLLFCLAISIYGQSPTSIQSGNSEYSYYPPSQDKESWQRLNLLLSSTFINVVNEGQIDLDSSLYAASHSLGLSRYSILGEGIDNPKLFEQSKWIDEDDPNTGIRLLSKVNGKEHLQLLILLGSYYAFERAYYQPHKDSVDYFLTQAINVSRTLKEDRLGRLALCLLGKKYLQMNHPRGDSIFNVLITQCRQVGDKETEARALVYRSRYTPPLASTIERKANDTREAAEIYASLGNKEGEINALTDYGYLLTVMGQLKPAEEIFLKALNLAEAIHFPYTHYNANTLSMITNFEGKFGEPLQYTYQMIKVSENCRDSIGWANFYAALALLIASEGRKEESLEITKKAIARFSKNRSPMVFYSLGNIVEEMAEKGQAREALELTQDIARKVKSPLTFTDQYFYHSTLVTCYMNLQQLDLAELHIRKMDSVETKAEAIRGPLRRAGITDMYGFLSFYRGEYSKAKEYLEKHFTYPSLAARTLASDLQIYRWLIIVDSALGDQTASISHYKTYTNLLDSNFKVTKIRQAEELQLTYRTREKENEIASLTQQAKLNSERASVTRNVTLAGIVAALIIAGLLYRQNRLKQKSNKVITRKNEELELLLADKERLLNDREWLLREIHHRVKNNLQIVMSLLNSQSAYIDNGAALTAIEDSQRRVHAMALIHQKLYQSENISSIAMQDYINELISYIRDSFDSGNRIVMEQQIEPLDLDVSQAIPLGLIVNESVVNAIKYAFPNEQKGIVSIKLHQEENGHILLNISDNGIGLPSKLDIKQHNSLGLDLMQGLAKQLNGSFSLENNNGLHIMVRFKPLNKQIFEPIPA